MADIGRVVTSSSLVFKIAVMSMFVILIIHIIGYSTDNWIKAGNSNLSIKHGLWKICVCFKAVFKAETCVCTPIETGSGWNIESVRALETLGLIGILLSLLFSTLGVARDDGNKWKTFSVVSCFGSGLFVLVGIIIYVTTTEAGHYLHFSFGLCTGAGCGIFGCGFLLVADKNASQQAHGGAVVQNTNRNGLVIQPAYLNPAQIIHPFQQGLPPPPYNQAQYSSQTFTTFAYGQSHPAMPITEPRGEIKPP